MSEIVLKDLIRFRGDRLFHGAVNLSWFWDDSEKNHLAAESYVFHGPNYHGVQQSDIGLSNEHRLQDTATFLKNIINSCYSKKDNPFTLAIAGYGTGKSHLALTIANLLSNPGSDLANTIISNVEAVDANIGKKIRLKFLENNKPCLVVALNGMKNFDLTSEISKQIYKQINSKNIGTTPLDELRPRFVNIISLLNILNDSLKEEIKRDCNIFDFEEIIESLKEQDERIYKLVYDFLLKHGFSIQSLGGESIDDIISTVVNEYCGENKPFQSLVFLFDEFGRYTEFATTRSQITGSGVLQSLYEGIQNNSEKVSFIGFIQFELNAYLQRIAPEYKNEIIRFITRYQSSNKVYLSVNLETLIASLIQKNNNRIESLFDNELSLKKSGDALKNINKWFTQSRNHNLWKNTKKFHKIISKGCWPLSPFSTWFLYHLTASGKHLQERSALALLNDNFDRFSNQKITDLYNWYLHPTDLWTKDLEQEFISSEDLGQTGSITHSYVAVLYRYKEKLSGESIKLLQAIVLSLKMGVQIENQQEALMVFEKLCGLNKIQIEQGLDSLKTEFNVIEWDETIKFYDVLSDSASRTQFLLWLKQKVKNIYDEKAKTKLFMGKAAKWFNNLLKDLECDFAEENLITTKEWYFQARTSDLEMLPNTITVMADSWEKSVSVDNPRGSIIYCYINQNYNLKDVISSVKKQLTTISFEKKMPAIPIIVVLLYDEDGELGQYLIEYSILVAHISKQDIQKFGNLIKIHKEKLYTTIQSLLEKMLKDRYYITPLANELKSTRLNGVTLEVFKNIYSDVLPFYFDGFSTARGNAANTCLQLTKDLLLGKLDYNKVLAMQPQDKNRSLTVLKESWGIFNQDGSISSYPSEPIAKKIIEDWEETFNSDSKHFNIGNEIIRKIKPPYGANIASIGLLFGVFIAARFDSLIFQKDGHQFAILQLIDNGDIFEGRFLDIDSLKNLELVKVGDDSVSEWQNLLDKWERCESYRDKIKYYIKSRELKNRIPIPNKYVYRYENLCKQSLEAEEAIRKKEKNFNASLMKIEKAIEVGNMGDVSWGVTELLDLQEKMKMEKPAWTTHEINELSPHIERAKQLIIQHFSSWLARQVPRGESLEQLGDFKHYLLKKVGGNLQKLGLDDLYIEVVKKVQDVTRVAEETAKVKQLDRDIESFLQMNDESVFKMPRLVKLRGLQRTAQEYISKSKEISPDLVYILNKSITELHQFLNRLKETEKLILEKAMVLWNIEIHSFQEVEEVRKRINNLIPIFEGCEADLEELVSMDKAIKYFEQFNKKLNEELTWDQFETISKNMKRVIIESFEEDEITWSIEDILTTLYEEKKYNRIRQSIVWLDEIKKEFNRINSMNTSEASQLHTRVNNHPTFLTEQEIVEANKISNQIEKHLNKLALEWLVEKFKELPEPSKKEFLKIAQQIIIT